MEITSVIIKPKITEKTQNIRSFVNPKMAFFVNTKSTKYQVSEAFKVLFGVKPSKVNIVNKKPSPTRVTSRSRKNFTKPFKIAYVTVASEDFLNLQKNLEKEENINENSLDVEHSSKEVEEQASKN